MYRRVLNLAALAIVSAGAAHLLAEPAAAATEEYCCTSGDGNYTCCGTSYCSANENSCSARDKVEALQ